MAQESSLPEDVEELMKSFGLESGGGSAAPAGAPASAAPASPKPAEGGASKLPLEKFPESRPGAAPASLEMLKDIKLHVRVEIGRTRMYVQDVLRLGSGSVVELDHLTGDPLDVYVNDRLVARGEVLVINENFALRITEVIHPARGEEKARE